MRFKRPGAPTHLDETVAVYERRYGDEPTSALAYILARWKAQMEARGNPPYDGHHLHNAHARIIAVERILANREERASHGV